MAKLEKLTKEQEALMAVVRDEWIAAALGGDTSIDELALKEWLNFCYGRISRKTPPYEICGGPFEAQKRANDRNGNTKMKYYSSGLGFGYDSGWVSFYDFFTRIGILTNADFNAWIGFKKAGVWDCVLFENVAYIIRRPLVVNKDAQGRLHCENGGAVMFSNGEKYYSWHGTRVPERLIMNAPDVSKEDLLAERNAEIVRAWGEKIGWTKFFDLIDAVLIDEEKDGNTGLTYALYDLKNRPSPEFARFLKMRSPQLNDGHSPYYVEPVHPQLNTAMAARKWKVAISPDGSRPTPQTCNKNPEIRFLVET